MKEKFNYLVKLLKSIANDLKSWKQIIYNKWHKHVPIGMALGFVIYWLLGNTLVDSREILELGLKIFVPSFLTFLLCVAWERMQGRNRTIEDKETFESQKDIIMGAIPGVIGVVISILIFK